MLWNYTFGIKHHSSERHFLIYFCVNVYLHLDRGSGFMGMLVGFMISPVSPWANEILETSVSYVGFMILSSIWMTASVSQFEVMIEQMCRKSKITVFEKIKNGGLMNQKQPSAYKTKLCWCCPLFMFLQWNRELSSFVLASESVFCFLLSLFCQFWCCLCDTAP